MKCKILTCFIISFSLLLVVVFSTNYKETLSTGVVGVIPLMILFFIQGLENKTISKQQQRMFMTVNGEICRCEVKEARCNIKRNDKVIRAFNESDDIVKFINIKIIGDCDYIYDVCISLRGKETKYCYLNKSNSIIIILSDNSSINLVVTYKTKAQEEISYIMEESKNNEIEQYCLIGKSKKKVLHTKRLSMNDNIENKFEKENMNIINVIGE